MNRQLISFLSLFSLVLILSIYYITLPFDSTNISDAPVNVQIQDSTEVYFATLTSQKNAEYELILAENNAVLASATATVEEKAVALENISRLNNVMALESTTAESIVDSGFAAAYVENYDNVVNVVVYKEDPSKVDAANIMNIVFTNFGNNVTPEIKFYS